MARCFSWRITSRRCFSSSGTRSSMASAAVLGRGEYLKLKSESYCTWSSRSQRLLEILFGLAGEAHDDVGGDASSCAARSSATRCGACIRRACRGGPWRPAPSSSRIAPAGGRGRRCAALRIHGVHDVLHEIARVRRGVADAADARRSRPRAPAASRNPSRRARDRGSCSRSVPATGSRCSPAAASRARFGHHALAGAAALGAARERHHAVGAAICRSLR